jgi:hypothetical protein
LRLASVGKESTGRQHSSSSFSLDIAFFCSLVRGFRTAF